MTDLNGATALVTGAASGIGLRMAEQFARRGASLVLWDLNGEALESARARVARAGNVAHTDTVDVGDHKAVAAAAVRVSQAVGGVDLLVNNAGIVSGRPLTDLTPEQVERTFRVNVLSLFWVTQAFLPGMVDRNRGHVVTIASAAGLVGVARQTDYSASKHAAVGFNESLRAELAAAGTDVHTTVVCPYFIDTGMFDGVVTRFPRLLPILKPDHVVDQITRAIEHDRAQLIMPPLIRSLPALRALPVAVFDRAMGFFGVNASMDHFTGRQGAGGVASASKR